MNLFFSEEMTRWYDVCSFLNEPEGAVLFSQLLKEEFKTRFRNVSRIMDCVGCDKCRLWGKIQTTGLGVAMKVLFELDENTLKLVLTSLLPTNLIPSTLPALL
jgi:hypothetical protein